ncbi:hypothetical protein E2C01_072356 [Portunus trituberculatus]|uniref:Uncharacterized protein n=1 Tax=Portunus trituberculatus TaxID=210409 RepID=A0A5B7I8R3_PORTR|nr:hypothetical protein [Portunus trituberculatus]
MLWQRGDDLVGMSQEVIQAVFEDGIVKGPVLKAELCVQVRALGVYKNHYCSVQEDKSVAIGTVVDGTD